jgi:hypothetical protein
MSRVMLSVSDTGLGLGRSFLHATARNLTMSHTVSRHKTSFLRSAPKDHAKSMSTLGRWDLSLLRPTLRSGVWLLRPAVWLLLHLTAANKDRYFWTLVVKASGKAWLATTSLQVMDMHDLVASKCVLDVINPQALVLNAAQLTSPWQLSASWIPMKTSVKGPAPRPVTCTMWHMKAHADLGSCSPESSLLSTPALLDHRTSKLADTCGTTGMDAGINMSKPPFYCETINKSSDPCPATTPQ